MKKTDEGYIKYNANHRFEKIEIDHDIFEGINHWRTILFDKGFIGETADGIGYGNISVRYNEQILISGSATGAQRVLSKEHYALVEDFDFELNSVKSIGLTKASSESLSHAALYQAHKNIMAVMHIHNFNMWNKVLNILPTTPKNVSFGTPAMAHEIMNLSKQEYCDKSKIIIMGGHQDGILSFGNTLDEAGKKILNLKSK